MRVLNVAEKPSVAKEISAILGGSNLSRRSGKSKFNPVFEFPCSIQGRECEMVFTSVSGHLFSKDFAEPYRKNWRSCSPTDLFHLPVVSFVPEDNKPIEHNLIVEARRCQWLILWLDCDREGENIAFEVMEVCEKSKPGLDIYRARFSKIVPQDIKRALSTLNRPKKLDSDAVNVRIEADLRIGAAYTRWQSLHLQSKYSGLSDKLISYGPCQFPTLGFVVDRYHRIENFVEEEFWSIRVVLKTENSESSPAGEAVFTWDRTRLFDRQIVICLYEMCVMNPLATVVDKVEKEKRKWKPLPLNTVGFQKLCARKLRISSERAMAIAEKLYQQGYLSYPRTETEVFEQGMDLRGLIEIQSSDPSWGEYATFLLNGGFVPPRTGKGNDHSHPPIHPTKKATNLQEEERKIYELITRSFLAACSADALGHQTTVRIKIAEEKFHVTGLIVKELNFLKVYHYEQWSDKYLPSFELHQQFFPTEIMMTDGMTQAPSLLSEADLIALMDSHGIGTDATIAQHIQTLLTRQYAEKRGPQNLFHPTTLGIALVEAYDAMGLELSKPFLRAKQEAELCDISNGKSTPQTILKSNLDNYLATLNLIMQRTNLLETVMQRYFDPIGMDYAVVVEQFSICGKCLNMLSLKSKGEEYVLTCANCNLNISLPKSTEITPFEHICPLCQFQAISIRSRQDKTYQICPNCFHSNPDDVSLPCFKCTANCPLAGGSVPFRVCPICRSGGLKFKKRGSTSGSSAGEFFVSCSSYPACKASFSLPTETESATILQDRPCTKCSTNENICYCVLLQFKKTMPGIGKSITGCLSGCETTMNDLILMRNANVDNYLIPPNLLPAAPPSLSRTASTGTASHASFSNSSARSLSNNTTNRTPASTTSSSKFQSASTYRKRDSSPPASGNFSWSSVHSLAPASKVSVSPHPLPGFQPSSSFSSGPSSFSSSSSTNANFVEDDDNGDIPTCNCGVPCKKLTVKKASENQGREFYACANGMKGCHFSWVDESNAPHEPPKKIARKGSERKSTTRTTSSRGRGKGTSSRGKKGSSDKGNACYKCGQPGHFASICDQN